MAEKPFSGSEDEHIIVLREWEKLQNQNLQAPHLKMHDRLTEKLGQNPCKQIRKLNGIHSVSILGCSVLFKNIWLVGKREQSVVGFLKLQCTIFQFYLKNQKSLAGTATVVKIQWVNGEFKKIAKNKNLFFSLFKSDFRPSFLKEIDSAGTVEHECSVLEEAST